MKMTPTLPRRDQIPRTVRAANPGATTTRSAGETSLSTTITQAITNYGTIQPNIDRAHPGLRCDRAPGVMVGVGPTGGDNGSADAP